MIICTSNLFRVWLQIKLRLSSQATIFQSLKMLAMFQRWLFMQMKHLWRALLMNKRCNNAPLWIYLTKEISRIKQAIAKICSHSCATTIKFKPSMTVWSTVRLQSFRRTGWVSSYLKWHRRSKTTSWSKLLQLLWGFRLVKWAQLILEEHRHLLSQWQTSSGKPKSNSKDFRLNCSTK